MGCLLRGHGEILDWSASAAQALRLTHQIKQAYHIAAASRQPPIAI